MITQIIVATIVVACVICLIRNLLVFRAHGDAIDRCHMLCLNDITHGLDPDWRHNELGPILDAYNWHVVDVFTPPRSYFIHLRCLSADTPSEVRKELFWPPSPEAKQ